ncbi:MAG: hypothetical protein LBL60_00505 [Mycoplasmataceae bacterium]|nr:hypothetical protein [Mycoplasmataceae bacterium]
MTKPIKNIYSVEKIKNMSEQEWQQFRLETWKKKQEYYARPTPIWYMKDKESYAQFLEKAKKIHEQKSAPIYEKKSEMTKIVDDLSAGYEDDFADEF